MRVIRCALLVVLLFSVFSGASFGYSIPPDSGYRNGSGLTCRPTKELACLENSAYNDTDHIYCERSGLNCGYLTYPGSTTCYQHGPLQECSDSCPLGYEFNSGTGECDSLCTWPDVPQLDGTCAEYNDCPAGQSPDPLNEFQCIANCPAGESINLSRGLFWAHGTSGLSITVDEPLCTGGCEFGVTNIEVVTTYPAPDCGTVNGEEYCGTQQGYTVHVAALSNGQECAGEPNISCPSCVGPPDPGDDPDAPQDPPSDDPPPPPGESEGDTTIEEETVDNGDGTTTTTRQVTYPDGSTTTTTTTTETATGATSQTVSTTGGQSDEEDKPEPQRKYSGGACAAAPFCSGDPIDCAIARHLWEAKCQLSTDVEVDEASIESEVGDSDFESLIGTETVDVSDPLTLGGYIEQSAPACPADYSVSLWGESIAFSWHWLCEFLLLIRGLVMAAGILVSGLIFYRGLVREF